MVEQRFGKYGIYFENLCGFFFFLKNGPELVLLQVRLCNSTVQDCMIGVLSYKEQNLTLVD